MQQTFRKCRQVGVTRGNRTWYNFMSDAVPLEQHMKIHSGETPPNICEFCGKSFLMRSNLKVNSISMNQSCFEHLCGRVIFISLRLDDAGIDVRRPSKTTITHNSTDRRKHDWMTKFGALKGKSTLHQSIYSKSQTIFVITFCFAENYSNKLIKFEILWAKTELTSIFFLHLILRKLQRFRNKSIFFDSKYSKTR